MENVVQIIKTVNDMVLDLITIEELGKKCIKKTNFKWIFNSKNTNIIPVLELYNKKGVYKTIESTEFSELLQDLLTETQKLQSYTNNTHDSKTEDELLKHIAEEKSDCSDCEIKEICPFGMDKDE